MMQSKSKIDKAGQALSKQRFKNDDEYLELEYIFDDYRKIHLKPLTETTVELQGLLRNYGCDYYIAQRLKRKPQILRKLNRLSIRLTQLQDIGGCRIIVDSNKDVNNLSAYIRDKVKMNPSLKLERITDYRDKGRDDTGYRALHLMLSRDGVKIELQIRSMIQHYWAEGVERASVIYGHHLKEHEGDYIVIQYFKALSNIFYEIESGREPSPTQKLEIDFLRDRSEETIMSSDKSKNFYGYVDESIIKTLASKESGTNKAFNNWIIVFDWNTCSFVHWDIVDCDPQTAISAYVQNERIFPASDGYEVVLIGSSNVQTIRQTHSHYFGIEKFESILEKLDESVINFSKRMDIDTGARQILLCMARKKYWGKNIAIATLKNHYCKNVLTFNSSLETLITRRLVISQSPNGPITLNIGRQNEINKYL